MKSHAANDVYYMPRPEELVDRMGHSQFITTLDMTKGFYQVPMNPNDSEKTAFVTPFGKFKFHFSLKNSPATFHHLVDDLLEGTQICSAGYIDDEAVFSNTWKEHFRQLKEILSRLRKAGLTLRAEKYLIGASTCTFLGYEVRKGKISPMEAKIAAVKQFAKPKTKKDIRAFLGLTGYYRCFIDRYAARTVGLTDALAGSKPDKIVWTEQMEQEFNLLKKALTEKPVLAALDFDRTFIVQTDASIRGVGAILSQQFDDGERPIAFFSK